MTWFTRGSNSMDTVKFSISNGRSKFSRLTFSKMLIIWINIPRSFFFLQREFCVLRSRKGGHFLFLFFIPCSCLIVIDTWQSMRERNWHFAKGIFILSFIRDDTFLLPPNISSKHFQNRYISPHFHIVSYLRRKIIIPAEAEYKGKEFSLAILSKKEREKRKKNTKDLHMIRITLYLYPSRRLLSQLFPSSSPRWITFH